MSSYHKSIQHGAVLTGLIYVIFLYFNHSVAVQELLISSVYFLILYGFIFTMGRPAVVKKLQDLYQNSKERALWVPLFLFTLLASHYLWHGINPFTGSSGLYFFLYLFPVLAFLAFPRKDVAWADLWILLLVLIPSTIIHFPGNSDLPWQTSGFSSVQKITLILGAAYSFVVVRKLPEVGFYPTWKASHLSVALGSWISFLGFVYFIGIIWDFNINQPFQDFGWLLIPAAIRELIRVYIGTALFEELFFRGLIQNILARKINLATHWKSYWIWGGLLFTLLSFFTGYAMYPALFWFPGVISLVLFAGAYLLEKNQVAKTGTYTALAITSMFFGLVHFHAGSVIFVGLASVAGWAYGYTYIKTKNVFYAALVHCLVNCSEFLFSLHSIK
ncbi:CPBP family intramembrane glutamic endopeptidase [Aquirufa rosea]|uniref:CPBP family intramembrane metalloprotease n=1 Tax=Aquirufa rosea TaxID=2509241 RepID=A0A4Q1C0P1_9BACT|nr:CPBP family intramembrane glutamic endopeptidase [Aquirufa rosea]RXK50668.1 CPBP family intramembrane metalloprotease [Aquirufa rosea]